MGHINYCRDTQQNRTKQNREGIRTKSLLLLLLPSLRLFRNVCDVADDYIIIIRVGRRLEPEQATRRHVQSLLRSTRTYPNVSTNVATDLFRNYNRAFV